MADDGDVDGDDKEKSVHEDIVSLLLDYFIKDKQQIFDFSDRERIHHKDTFYCHYSWNFKAIMGKVSPEENKRT